MSNDNAPTPPPWPPAQRAPQTPQTRARPWWKASWALLGAGAIVGLVIGVSSGAASTSAAKPGPTVTATAVRTTTTTATATVTTTPTRVVATKVRTATVTYTPPPVHQVSDGTYRIGPDVPPGVYKTAGGSQCYYAILNSLDNEDIASNDNFSGPTVVRLPANKTAFQVSGGCTWSKVG